MTRSRGGPTPHLRRPLATKVEQGAEAHRLHQTGLTFAEVSTQLGLSKTTAWRRACWWADWTRPATLGLPIRRIPPQRSTKACPRGRPCIPELDHAELSQPARQRCGARRRDGLPCQSWPMRGQARCRMHGGSSGQAQRAAARRLDAEAERRRIRYQLHTHC